MVSKLISAAVFSSILGLTMLSSQAEARRLFWWEALPPENGGGYDIYGDGQDYQDGQDTAADDMFNQQQYDQYMKEMNHRRHRRIYDQSYYDPQIDNTDIPESAKPKSKVLKFKKPAVVKTARVEPVVPFKPVQQAYVPKILKRAEPHSRLIRRPRARPSRHMFHQQLAVLRQQLRVVPRRLRQIPCRQQMRVTRFHVRLRPDTQFAQPPAGVRKLPAFLQHERRFVGQLEPQSGVPRRLGHAGGFVVRGDGLFEFPFQIQAVRGTGDDFQIRIPPAPRRRSHE